MLVLENFDDDGDDAVIGGGGDIFPISVQLFKVCRDRFVCVIIVMGI